jgi:hypothetical protein
MPTLETGTWIATGLTAVSALLMPFVWRGLFRAVFVVSASMAVALWHARLHRSIRSPVEHVAFGCALLSLGWLVVGELLCRLRGWRGHRGEVGPLVNLARPASLAFGAVAAVLLSVQLGMRGAYTLVDLVNNFPGRDVPEFGFSINGAWSLGLLLGAAVLGLARHRDRRLLTCVFVIGVMLVAWIWLAVPLFTATDSGGYRATGVTLGLQASWSAWMLAFVLLVPFIDRRIVVVSASSSEGPVGEAHPPHPGLQLCSGALAVTIALLVFYHLIVPLRWSIGGFYFPALVTALSCAMAATACFRWLAWGWSRLNAEAGLGLVSLSLCALIVAVVPVSEDSLQAAYPVVFNAIMVGFCITTLLYVWRAETWFERSQHGALLETYQRLIPHLRRFSFVAASLAFFVGVVMMIWPRLPVVAVMDDSLNRVCAGVGGNLLLLLSVLWSGRRMRQPAFHILTVLSVLSMAGFLLVRVLPFSSRVSG